MWAFYFLLVDGHSAGLQWLRPTSLTLANGVSAGLFLRLLYIVVDNVDWVSLVISAIVLVIIIIVWVLAVGPRRTGLSTGLHEHFLFAFIGALHLVRLGVDGAELGGLTDLTARVRVA